MLRRLGNKSRIAKKIEKHFPKHIFYIELFFGAGGMFFNKVKAQYNVLNDLDSDVYNLFLVLMNQRESFEALLNIMPSHEELFNHWKKNEETDPIKKAMRFLMLSNYGYMGKPETMRFANGNTKSIIQRLLKPTNEMLSGCEFMNVDFRKVLKKIPFRNQRELDRAFIYADPPYLGTDNNYESSFKLQDTKDLFEMLVSSNIKFAVSEFDNPTVLALAEEYKLKVIEIGTRQNMKNRRKEVLIINYESPQLSLF